MKLEDSVLVPGSLSEVYAALNDVEVLKASIPGCEELTRLNDGRLEALVTLKVGPVKARFNGVVTLDETGAPEKFALSGEGNGGPAGMAKGGAEVALAEEGEETRLTYTAKADVSGKIAQLGSRLIDSTAQRLSKQFFKNFAAEMERRAAPAEAAEAPAADVAPAPAAQPATPAEGGGFLAALLAPLRWIASLFTGRKSGDETPR